MNNNIALDRVARSSVAEAHGRSLARRLGRLGIVAVTVVAAVLINLLIHTLGRAAGATYMFTAAGQLAEVDAITLFGFTALPLAVGMSIAATFSLWWLWVIPAALIVAPLLELGSILPMILPSDHDTASKVALALCHTALVPVSIIGLLAIRSLGPKVPRV